MKGKIILFPMTLGESSIDAVIPLEVQEQLKKIRFLIVENIKTTRRYLKRIDKAIDVNKITFFELNKHTDARDLSSFLIPTEEGNDIGIISEAGCPGIADPGSEIVRIAHNKNIQVVPMVGPSSILLALISSGMNGQQFTFNGYLPFEKQERNKKLKIIEKQALNNVSQIFMEPPFRNNKLLNEILQRMNSNLRLCIACDITLETEFIQTKNIKDWRNNKPNLNKRPTMFVLVR